MWVAPDGDIVVLYSLQWIPFAGWATWVEQVMPIFFFCGGYANARSLSKHPDTLPSGRRPPRQSQSSAPGPERFAAGGIIVKRVGITDVVAGTPGPGFVFVMDFADVETIRSVFESSAYAALIPVRDKGFERMEILITEDLPPTGN